MAFANSRAHSIIFKFNAMNILGTIVAILFSMNSEVGSQNGNNEYKIVCYYNYWSNYYTPNGKFQVENIDPFLCTHLVYAYVGINSCSDIMILDPQLQGGVSYRGREDFKRFIGLKKKNPMLKCLVAFGGYNGDHVRFSRIISNAEKKEQFISNVITFMDDYCLDDDTCFDGVSLDYYYPRSESDDGYNYFVELLVDMRSEFTEHYEEGVYKIIAVAASALGTRIQDYYNIPEITEKADFVSLVTYDYYGPTWSNNKTGFVAPLYGRKLPNGQEDTLNQNSTVHAWLNEQLGPVHRKKLLLGMPTYGRSFNLANNTMTNVGDPTTGAATIGPYTNTPGFFTYNELVNEIFRYNQNWTKEWDDEQEVPYAYKDNIWISYENEKSFAKKAYYIKHDTSLGGAMINSIDADDFKSNYSLIQTVKNILSEDNVTKSDRMVCYFNAKAGHRNGDGYMSPEHIDPNACTHLIYGFAKLLGNKITPKFPEIDLEENYGKDFYKKFNSLRSKNSNLITLIAIGGWTEEDLGSNGFYSDMASDTEKRKIFVDSVLEFLKKYDFQGLDLCWEYAHSRHRRFNPEDKVNYIILLKELKEAFQPHAYLLTAAVSAAKPTNEGAYDIPQVSKYLDFINVMTFDFNVGISFTAANSPLYARPEETGNDRFLNVDHTIRHWIEEGANKKKMTMGIPFYGRCFKLADKKNTDYGARTVDLGTLGPHTQQPGYMGYNELCWKARHESWTTDVWNQFHIAPYMYSGDQWCSYEEGNSVLAKVNYLRAMGLGGAMVWSLDTDDFKGLCAGKFPLLSIIVRELKSKEEPDLPHTPPWNHTHPSTVSTPEDTNTTETQFVCTSEGSFSFPNDCSKHFQCLSDDGNFYVLVERSCPAGTVFNPEKKFCDHAKNVPGCN